VTRCARPTAFLRISVRKTVTLVRKKACGEVLSR
jgi:hypothetical protein